MPAAANHAYDPSNQMMVMRSPPGMREFDWDRTPIGLRIPDQDSAEHAFWTDVAERMVQILSAYTGEGVMFAIDTRLRPTAEGDWCNRKALTSVFRGPRRGREASPT